MRCLSELLLFILSFAILATTGPEGFADDPRKPDFNEDIAPLLTKYCAGCHSDSYPEADLSLESYESMMKGIDGQPVLFASDVDSSLLWQVLAGKSETVMPPEGEPAPTDAERELLKQWIAAGAIGPEGKSPSRLMISVPAIPSQTDLSPILSLAFSPDGNHLAIARYGAVELLERSTADAAKGEFSLAGRITDLPGKVTSVHFSKNGEWVVTSSGVAGSGGVATIWNAVDGNRIRDFIGHRDILFDAQLSPDEQFLATCSYDRQIILWDVTSGEPLRTMAGHNGAVYDVAFSPDGMAIASASADDTCKLWRVADGERLDTMGQPLSEQYSITFTPDGKSVIAAGADNRLRVWQFVSRETPKINPLQLARFAHEAPIVALSLSEDGSRLITAAEDRTVKVWDTSDYREIWLKENEPDVVSAIEIAPDGATFVVGRLDGSWQQYPMPKAIESHEHHQAQPVMVKIPEVSTSGDPAAVPEVEPNDTPQNAQPVELPARITGEIRSDSTPLDLDTFRFSAGENEEWVIEVLADRNGSQLDSVIEVLTEDGKPIERVLLQAVRDSYFTFRGKDSKQVGDFRLFNWEEMNVNEYVYANGEVFRLWLAPRGPDSGFNVFPGLGDRWTYFGTTALAHALGEPAYVVLPHPPGTELVPNGLPTFPLYYVNDDGSRRDTGRDSKLTFVAPHNGDYLVRVTDVRGQQGSEFQYELRIRPRQPEFNVRLQDRKLTMSRESSSELIFIADRLDEFDGPIEVEITGLPEGLSANTPVTIEESQLTAAIVITSGSDAMTLDEEALKGIQITASADIRGERRTAAVPGFESLKVEGDPKLRLQIVAAEGGATPVGNGEEGPLEFEIHPGETIMLKLNVDRLSFDGEIPLGTEGAGRNLPHGVYVDNLGLNGLLLLEGQSTREFFITASDWVQPQTRMFHLRTEQAGQPATQPVILHIR